MFHATAPCVESRKGPNKFGSKLGPKFEESVILDYLEFLGSPRALAVWLLYRSGEHRQLVELSIDPLLYQDVERFRVDYAATKLLSKTAGLDTGIDVEEVAISAAQAAEDQCRLTNERLRGYLSGSREPALVAKGFLYAQRKIADILGDRSSFSFDEFDVGWSRGRTTSAYGVNLSSTKKYFSRPDVTPRASSHALSVLRHSPHWGAAAIFADGPCSVIRNGLHLVEGNVQIVVPKNAKTGRVICYEPHLNIRLQLAVGNFIRQRLKKSGVDLDHQHINQRRALFSSKTGTLATIDLKSASDTISLELVRQLLPVDWYVLLCDLRSARTDVGGHIRTNEKFSSMGNGFTFELESLIFYALCSSVTSNVTVYGDDIILPSEKYDEVVELLGYAGFTINTSKSFSTGWFRESCGMDAFRGVDCTPVYMRTRLNSVELAVRFHNAVYAWASRDCFPSRTLQAVLQKWRTMIPAPVGPQGFGDGHLHICFDEALPSRASRGWCGWWFTTYARVYKDGWIGHSVGVVPRRLGSAAICAATGPKRLWNIVDSEKDRRRFRTVRTRAVANVWPSLFWV